MMSVIMHRVIAPFFLIMKKNQLPVSVARWQHWSRIHPSSLFVVKIHININNLTADIFKVKTKQTQETIKFLKKHWCVFDNILNVQNLPVNQSNGV
jgi:hypothetical protein